ncbi:MAG: thymidine phosphorylase, partial [Rhodospirillaceae bacterium]|nr:thymidine phosphorylase [Rhodospirillaceae bacterium]
EMARELAESIVAVANGAGLRCRALITDMNQVLGRNVGNALEVAEALTFLQNENLDPRLREIVLTLAREMLDLAGLSADPEAALTSGRALEVFARMVSQLGGPADLVENAILYLPRAPVSKPCVATRAGMISAMDTRTIGVAVLAMGGGRRDAADTIDPRVGLTDVCALGDRIEVGQPLAMVHGGDENSTDAAIAQIRAAISIDAKGIPGDIILERVDAS